jgi:hypothetical protein
MIRCATCHQNEIAGTLFCRECGAQLKSYDLEPPQTAEYPRETIPPGSLAPPHSILTQRKTGSTPSEKIALRIIEVEQILELIGSSEYTLGRVGGNQPILPDIDLTPFQAYESGVSRLHATLKIKDKIIWVTDLGSANGTRVNGKKIPAHAPFPLEHKDILTLGNLKVQMLFHENE